MEPPNEKDKNSFEEYISLRYSPYKEFDRAILSSIPLINSKQIYHIVNLFSKVENLPYIFFAYTNLPSFTGTTLCLIFLAVVYFEPFFLIAFAGSVVITYFACHFQGKIQEQLLPIIRKHIDECQSKLKRNILVGLSLQKGGSIFNQGSFTLAILLNVDTLNQWKELNGKVSVNIVNESVHPDKPSDVYELNERQKEDYVSQISLNINEALRKECGIEN